VVSDYGKLGKCVSLPMKGLSLPLLLAPAGAGNPIEISSEKKAGEDFLCPTL
jgi:hypothetical protein